jgi:hypothetical protein
MIKYCSSLQRFRKIVENMETEIICPTWYASNSRVALCKVIFGYVLKDNMQI